MEAIVDVSAPGLEISVSTVPLESLNDPSWTSQAALIARAKTDPAAFGQLYETHYSAVLNFIYRCTLNVALAEELTSNTFFKALQAIGRYDHRSSLSAWFYRIAMNEVRMYWRSSARRRRNGTRLPLEETAERVFFDVSAMETEESRRERMRMFADLHELVESLPQRYRSVLILRFFEGLSYEAIAEVVEQRVGTVKSLVHRGVERLRKKIAQDATRYQPWHLDD